MDAFKRAVGDVETYPNFWSCYYIDYDSDKEIVFEISERKNQLSEFVDFTKDIKYFIGFNSMHYDNIIMMYLYKNYKTLKDMDYLEITALLKNLNDAIIDDDGSNYNRYKKYKYNHPYVSIDLFLYWSKMLRLSKKLSLKSLAVNMNWPRIQELPLPPSHIVQLHEIDDIIDYNGNDSRVTKKLAMEMKKEINLRGDAKKLYGFDCWSWDGVKLGLNILVKRYSDRVGLPQQEISELRSPREAIDIGSLLLPIIKFKEADAAYHQIVEKKVLITKFKSFYGLHQYLKTLTVNSTKDINCQVFLDSNRYDVKSGGLHTYHNGGIVVPGPDDIYEDDDVSSYYPTLGAKWGFIPEHLGNEFAEELESIRQTRLALKAQGLGKGTESELLKLSMNGGFYGNTNNEYTPMYDPKCMLSITMNGQLMLLMLCEQLMEIGVRIDMCNTDGVTIMYHKSLYDQVRAICKKWEETTRMELESVVYKKVVRRDINNYLALYEEKDKGTGEIKIKAKEKGMFMTDPEIDKSREFLVIAKALKEYYMNDTPIEEFIRNHKDIYDFCSAQKVDKKYTVWWNGQPQQRLNRYYVCKSGPYLYKSKDKGMEHMMKDWSVQLFNNFEEREDYGINYEFYIAETKKVMNDLSSQQLKMF